MAKPGSKWRFLAHRRDGRIDLRSDASDPSVFDELVVDDWLHIEQMNDDVWWMQVGDARITVQVRHGQPVSVNVQRGEYAGANGWTELSPAERYPCE